MASVLIVEDDDIFRKSLAQVARDEGLEIHVAATLADARFIARCNRIDLIALDLDLPDGDGLDLIDDVDLSTHGRVVVMTGNPTVETAARAVAMPVLEYLLKPVQMRYWAGLLRETRAREQSHLGGQPELVGWSKPIRAVVGELRMLAPLEIAVLIMGDTGTGKELAARMLHDGSGRIGDFVSINCGAIPRELLLAELFGSSRGGFADAGMVHASVFERASGGTLFLDEITEMPPELQIYLLRALEAGAICRVGDTAPVESSARVVAATSRDPAEAVVAGRLRKDLYYHLADAVVRMPGLRECGDDIVLLAEVFVARLNERYGRNKRLARGSAAALKQHAWPGNVRELRSAVQRAYLMGTGDTIKICIAETRAAPMQELEEGTMFRVGMTLAEVERNVLLKTLAGCGNDKTAAARMLGISVRTIHNQLARIASGPADSRMDSA